MKKNLSLTVCVLLFLCSVATAQNHGLHSLFGEWEAIDSKNQNGGLMVMDSSKLYLVYGDQKMEILSFKADFSRSPCWFDFTIKSDSTTIHLKSLMQFINKDMVQWQIFDEETRPQHFSTNKGEMIYMKRKQPPVIMAMSE